MQGIRGLGVPFIHSVDGVHGTPEGSKHWHTLPVHRYLPSLSALPKTLGVSRCCCYLFYLFVGEMREALVGSPEQLIFLPQGWGDRHASLWVASQYFRGRN